MLQTAFFLKKIPPDRTSCGNSTVGPVGVEGKGPTVLTQNMLLCFTDFVGQQMRSVFWNAVTWSYATEKIKRQLKGSSYQEVQQCEHPHCWPKLFMTQSTLCTLHLYSVSKMDLDDLLLVLYIVRRKGEIKPEVYGGHEIRLFLWHTHKIGS